MNKTKPISKTDLDAVLKEDLSRYNNIRPSFKDWLISNESWFLFNFMRHVRFLEYYSNRKGWKKLAYLYHLYKYKKYSSKLHITLYPFTVGGGLRIYHYGSFTHIGPNCKIGKNCTIQPGVVFGNKYEDETDGEIIVGDNCYFGLGAKILGSVTIGNNVIVGANAVITKDVPDNAIVAGVPAKIIRIQKG